ncbi:colanic acid biosynthesis glycosyl transferase wcaI [Corynebacterium casei LMG S-19264]|uniref:Colanic acid biosynthesis glycosyl transferase wcaI n=1 Tax=Corynebacterium casei LMG S-19264 TaxID=1285583 RepID=A0ABM5PNH7_9CORY|nr:glycosyltransferase family 4 protein [Corynebacterium casei]AHI19525.1 colanic acid biosynthesis glycosyl transferase wcaI [Corynebacterium casei LMG S-19264]
MKILIISQYWAPENGVPQRRWSWLTGILEEQGHLVTVIAPPPHYNRSPSLGEWWKSGSFRARTEHETINHAETVVRTGFFPAGRSLTQRILNQAAVAAAALWVIGKKPGVLRNYQPDLIIGSVPALPTSVVTYIASKRFKAPYVIDLRDAWPDLISEHERWNSGLGDPSFREKVLSRGPVQVLGFVTKWAMNYSLRESDGLIVTSSLLGKALKERFDEQQKSVDKPISVIRNVFPPEINQRVSEHEERSADCLNVLYAGTLGRAQNLTNAIRAVARTGEGGYQVNLRFVGAGAARQELVRLAKDLNVKVEFSSKLAADELAEQYKWADTALVHLTDWPALEQAVPSKTYELMNLGIHISAVASGETMELIEALEAGHVVAPESPEALAQLWMKLIDEPRLLDVSTVGAKWVAEERVNVAPREFLRMIDNFETD